MANINKLLNVSKTLREIVENQTQVRTNKLKPILEEISEIINDPSEGSAPKVESKEIEDIKTENKYLKRRQTMYDLKISKLEQEIKDLKKK